MHIYYPGLITYARTVNDVGRSLGIPLYGAGFYKDEDAGYFNQVTSGRDVNDIVHASLRSGDARVSVHSVEANNKLWRPVGSGSTSSTRNYFWTATMGSTLVTMYNVQTRRVLGGVELYACNAWLDGNVSFGRSGSSNTVRAAHAMCTIGWNLNNGHRLGIWGNPDKLPGLPETGSYYWRDPDLGRKFKDRSQALSFFRNWVEDNVTATWGGQVIASVRYSGKRQYWSGWDVTNWIPFPDGRRAFLLSEPSIYGEGIDPICLGNGLENGSYWRNWLIQHAYYDALQHVPKLSDNSISNIAELVGFIKSLVVDHRIEFPNSWQDAWLSYRYSYTTTKLDMEEAISFAKRMVGTSIRSHGVQCYGRSSTDIDGTVVTCQCGFEVKSTALDYVDKIWRALYTYGLQPNFYVVWDMIPYSFIVDWFIPVGDLASVLDTEASMMRGQYDIKNVCFSLSYDRELDGYPVHCYTRWASAPLPSLNGFYWFDKPRSSKRVTAFRVLDTGALFIGR
jgi:hypothetical protein